MLGKLEEDLCDACSSGNIEKVIELTKSTSTSTNLAINSQIRATKRTPLEKEEIGVNSMDLLGGSTVFYRACMHQLKDHIRL